MCSFGMLIGVIWKIVVWCFVVIWVKLVVVVGCFVLNCVVCLSC